jgi:hypothetical protein
MSKATVEVTKQPNLEIEYSAQMTFELIQCMDDPMYFMRNFMKIQHATKGSLPFEPYPFQERMIRAFHENRSCIALTARQMGKTTCAAGFLLWKAMFTPDTTILIVANNYNGALEIMSRVRYAYENLPDHIRAGATEYNKGTVAFDNGSKIVSRATSPDAARGLSISLLYCDEFAFLRTATLATEFWTSVQPTLSTGGSCIITSTPKSDEDQFAKIWKDAIDVTDDYGNPRENGLGKNDFYAIQVPWWEHPDRDEEWARPFRTQLGDARFRQEFCCEFVSDDETLIESLYLSKLKGADPIGYTDTVRWFKDPEPNRAYVVALDPSKGTGGDYASIQVWQLPEMVQVAEWQHNQTPTKGQVRMLLRVLHVLKQDLSGNALQNGEPEIYWSVEANGLGEAALTVISDTGEHRFPGQFVSEKKKPGAARNRTKGLVTTPRNKIAACLRFKSLVESGRATIHSKELIKQLKGFVATENSFKAKPGDKDDLVMATILCVRMIDRAIARGADVGDLLEHISEDDIFNEPMPVVV